MTKVYPFRDIIANVSIYFSQKELISDSYKIV